MDARRHLYTLSFLSWTRCKEADWGSFIPRSEEDALLALSMLIERTTAKSDCRNDGVCILAVTCTGRLRAIFLDPYRTVESREMVIDHRVSIFDQSIKVVPLPGINNFLVAVRSRYKSAISAIDDDNDDQVCHWWIASVGDESRDDCIITVHRTHSLRENWTLIGHHPIIGIGHLVFSEESRKDERPRLFAVKFDHHLKVSVQRFDDNKLPDNDRFGRIVQALIPGSSDYTVDDLIYVHMDKSGTRQLSYRNEPLIPWGLGNVELLFLNKNDVLYWFRDIDRVWKYNLLTQQESVGYSALSDSSQQCRNRNHSSSPSEKTSTVGYDATHAYVWTHEDDSTAAAGKWPTLLCGRFIDRGGMEFNRPIITMPPLHSMEKISLQGSANDFDNQHLLLLTTTLGQHWLVDFINGRYHPLDRMGNEIVRSTSAMNVSVRHAQWAAALIPVCQATVTPSDVLHLIIGYCLGYVPLLQGSDNAQQQESSLPRVVREMILGYFSAEELWIYHQACPHPWLKTRIDQVTAWEALCFAAGQGWIAGMEVVGDDIASHGCYNLALIEAAENGHVAAMDFLAARGANDWDGALIWAACNGHVEAMEWAAARGANDWTRAKWHASLGQHHAALEWLTRQRPSHSNQHPCLMAG